MSLRDFFTADCVRLDLQGTTPEEVLAELVGALGLDQQAGDTLLRILRRREELGSTGVGRGIAIPHGRSLLINHLRLVFGHHAQGLEYKAIDGKPVHNFFLIVAPPVEVSNQYLPVLGKIAQFCKESDVPERLNTLSTPEDFFALLQSKGV